MDVTDDRKTVLVDAEQFELLRIENADLHIELLKLRFDVVAEKRKLLEGNLRLIIEENEKKGTAKHG